MKSFKQTALTAALAMVVVSPMASAAGSFDAFVSGALGIGTTDYKYSDSNLNSYKDDTDNTLGQFRATAAYQDKSGFGGQMDFVYGTNDNDWMDFSSTDIAGHVFYRGGDWLVGGFGQQRTYDIDGGEGFHAPLKVTVWGAEVQKQLGGNMSIYGQLGRQELNEYGYTYTGWIGSVEGRYFVNDNLMFNGRLTYGNMKESGDCCPPWTGKSTNTAIEVGGEYRLANSMFSVFGSYAYLNDDFKYSNTDPYSEKDENESHQFMVGVKLNMGKESLRQRDREGASLNPMSLLGLPYSGGPMIIN